MTNNNFLEFSLALARHNTQFDFSSNSYDAKLESTGINWYEPFTQYFQAGLEFGYIEMLQFKNPQTSAQYTNGEYAGLLLRFLPFHQDAISLSLNINYRYNRTKGKNSLQETEFVWHETLFSSEIQFRPMEKISLSLAAEYQLSDGQRRGSGRVTQIETFKTNKQQGVRYGLHFNLSRSEIIGLEWLSGYKNGGRLNFIRKF